ncbi:hypothetical protein BC829DRAFT_352880, partial [Chytridium lagenaria]
PSLSIKALIKQYGSIAFLTYSLVSGISLTLWYTFIRLGLDVSRFTAILDTAKNAVFPSSPSSNILINEAEAVENPLSSFYATHGTTVLMAIAAHNVILPVRIGVTALLTPYVAARMRA